MELTLKKASRKYKQDIVPAVLALAGILLIIAVAIPQVSEIVELHDDLASQQETNDDLRQSELVLDAIADSQLDSDFELALAALPQEKSIGGIFDALTQVGDATGVTLGSFSFQPGDVYISESADDTRVVRGVPFVNMLVRMNGSDPASLQEFARQLYQSIPLVEINSMAISETEGQFDVNFYFKPVNSRTLASQDMIAPLTTQQAELLNTFREWER